jgi:hypothetical protein
MPTPPAAPAAPAQSGDACFRAVFAPDAFGAALPALCEQTDPIEGSKAIKVALVRGGIEAKTTTAAMKEWAVLGWYETAWLAAVQARCCSPAPTLKTHAALAECKLDEAIAAIAGAVKGSDSAAVEGAIATYSDAVHCIVNRKAGKLLGQKGEPKGFEEALLKTALLRAQAVR